MSLMLPDAIDQATTADIDVDSAGEPAHRASAPIAIPRGRSRLAQSASTLGWAVAGAAVFVALWHLGARQVANMPTPVDTWSSLRELLTDGFRNGGPGDQGVLLLLKSSLLRVLKGFVMAAILGIPLGMLIGSSPRAWKAVNPLIQFLRPVSPLAWYPVLLIIFLDADRASTWVICLTSLWPIVLNTAAGASSIPTDHRNVARVFHLTRRAYVRHVVVPHSLGSIVTGLRLSMGTAWMVIVAVEMMSGRDGIGNFVWNEYNAGAMPKVVASIVLIGTTGLLLDLVFLKLAKLASQQEAHS